MKVKATRVEYYWDPVKRKVTIRFYFVKDLGIKVDVTYDTPFKPENWSVCLSPIVDAYLDPLPPGWKPMKDGLTMSSPVAHNTTGMSRKKQPKDNPDWVPMNESLGRTWLAPAEAVMETIILALLQGAEAEQQ